jgi:hypothetical protein
MLTHTCFAVGCAFFAFRIVYHLEQCSRVCVVGAARRRCAPALSRLARARASHTQLTLRCKGQNRTSPGTRGACAAQQRRTLRCRTASVAHSRRGCAFPPPRVRARPPTEDAPHSSGGATQQHARVD